MNEDEIAGMLESEVMGTEAPMVAESEAQPSATDVQAQTEPQPQEQPVQEPQFDPSNLSNQMNQQAEAIQAIADNMTMLTNNTPKAQPEAPSEEDMLRQQMKKDLGLDKVEEQFKQQQELIKKQEEVLAQMQQAEEVRTRENEFKVMESEFGNIDRVAIQNKIMEIGKTNPDLADALNSPDGVRMLLKQGVGAVVAKPDSITPSSSGQDVDMSSQVDSLKNGTLDDSAFGQLLLDSMQ